MVENLEGKLVLTVPTDPEILFLVQAFDLFDQRIDFFRC